jgi:hypothetical protein
VWSLSDIRQSNVQSPRHHLLQEATSVMKIASFATMGLLSLVSLAAIAQTESTPGSDLGKAKSVVDAHGSLRVPADYRTSYQFLGSWAVAADRSEGSKQIHTVYASPGAVAAYRKDGRFPDGSVLVKEVFQTATAAMTTGTVSHAQNLKGWFVMVKDSKDSHPGNKLWGNGWGWSWFDAANPTKTTSTDFKVDCISCHVPARASDWIYVQGYPALRR